MSKKAVVLVSGGLDSATTLALAKQQGFVCYAMSFDYGQRHACELASAKQVAQHIGVEAHKTIHLDLTQIGGSALTDQSIAVPNEPTTGIPVTYVPARNTIFLAIALGWAEVLGAQDLFIGVNAVDYSGYPDCRPEYLRAFEAMANLATKAGVEGRAIEVRAPLVDLPKAEIVRRALALGVDPAMTVSCYQADADGRACGRCDACRIRRAGFETAGVVDVTRYQSERSTPNKAV
jgi:7-cyano-7-deazaguanine synthase